MFQVWLYTLQYHSFRIDGLSGRAPAGLRHARL